MSSAKHFTEVLIGGKVYTLSGFEGEQNVPTAKVTASRVQTPEMYFWH